MPIDPNTIDEVRRRITAGEPLHEIEDVLDQRENQENERVSDERNLEN